MSGTVTDSSGAVLPGVTIRAVHDATGNTFESVTDERGAYRLPVRVGSIRVAVTLAGFNTQTRTVELLVGQTLVVNAETTTSVLGGNVDPRQVQELPVNGRNYIALAMLAPGSRQVPVASSRENSERVLVDRNNNETREFLVNVDGQTVTSDFGSGGQPRYSQDSIAEFQYISNRFDATQGRSTGVQVT